MNKLLISAAVLALGGVLAGSLRADATFTFGFRVPDAISGPKGAKLDVPVVCTIKEENNALADGPKGWSMGFVIDGPAFDETEWNTDGLIVSTRYWKKLTLPPTDPDMFDLLNAEFLDLRRGALPPPDDTKQGIVCALVMSMKSKRVLQPTGTFDVLKGPVHPLVPSTFSLRWMNGLIGGGQPVDNVVSLNIDGADTSIPPLMTDTTDIAVVEQKDLNAIYSVVPASDTVTPPATAGDPAVYTKSVTVGPQSFPCVVQLTSQKLAAGDGPNSWSISLRQDPGLTLDTTDIDMTGIRVSTIYDEKNGTHHDSFDMNLLEADFTTFGLGHGGTTADGKGTLPADAKGLVCSVILRNTERMVLKPNTMTVVLNVNYHMDVVLGANPDAKAFFDSDLIGGDAQPVENLVNAWFGTTNVGLSYPDQLAYQNLLFKVTGVQQPQNPGKFARGDANVDGRVNIADAVYIVYAILFPSTQYDVSDCYDRADVNHSNTQDRFIPDLADAIYLLAYLFEDGPAPLPPFRVCDTDPHSTVQSCKPTFDRCIVK